jgi:hypothetical protein
MVLALAALVLVAALILVNEATARWRTPLRGPRHDG